MDNISIEKFLETKTNSRVANVHFKDRSTVTGLLLIFVIMMN